MSLVEHIIDEIHEITQEEMNIIHLEIHHITLRDFEGIESKEMSKQERISYNKQKNEIAKSEPYIQQPKEEMDHPQNKQENKFIRK